MQGEIMSDNAKRLYRSRKAKILGGVCGGIAEYLNIDPTLVRIAWIVLSIFPLIPGILIYIIAWIVIPKEPTADSSAAEGRGSVQAAAFFGFFFVGLGTILLLSNLDVFDWDRWWDVSWDYAVPILLIGLGVFFLVRPSFSERVRETPEGEQTGFRRLRRSVDNKKLFGVCGGLAEYFNVDPSLVRIGFVFFSVWPFGLGVLLYVLLLLVMPSEEVRHQPQT